jgi:glycogen synthase
VRATGGLKDTVKNFQFSIFNFQSNSKFKIQNSKFFSTGFVFNKQTPAELLNTLQQALDIFYEHPDIWRRLRVNGMKADFSWKKPAREYLDLYRKMIK